MSINLSKIKREKYIEKIEEIKKIISNTGGNLDYIHALNSLKKELNEKN